MSASVPINAQAAFVVVGKALAARQTPDNEVRLIAAETAAQAYPQRERTGYHTDRAIDKQSVVIACIVRGANLP